MKTTACTDEGCAGFYSHVKIQLTLSDVMCSVMWSFDKMYIHLEANK